MLKVKNVIRVKTRDFPSGSWNKCPWCEKSIGYNPKEDRCWRCKKPISWNLVEE